MDRSFLVLALFALPAAVLADPTGIVVEAGEPVPVPLEAVAERLRAELPGVSVNVAAPSTGGHGSVTLGLSAEGRLLLVYRDGSGRETTRIVADTRDPQAMAAAVAMIVANLHRSQVDSTLATLAPPPPASPPPSPPAPPIVQPAPAAIVVVARPAPAAVRTRAKERHEGWLSFGVGPFLDLFAGPVFGLQASADARAGRWRFDIELGYSPVTTDSAYVEDWGYYGFDYSQITLTAAARYLVIDGDRVRVGIGAGLGLLESEYEYQDDGSSPADSSWLDATILGTASFDLRILGGFWWSSRLDLAAAFDRSNYDYRPLNPDVWLRASTGLRVTL